MKSDFDYNAIPVGYYDKVWEKQKGTQSFWHDSKFRFLFKNISEKSYAFQVDIGCGPGTFLGNFNRVSRFQYTS